MVDQLFELAHLDEPRGTQLRLESFSMCKLAQDAVDQRQLACRQQSLTLTVTSTPGEGARFSVTLPA